ncbi:MAG TPA: hypothetical protein ENJ04_05920 [Nitrospirae bacterium]|nr:hypothetical protein [Nitrospirota bacterium]
MYRRIGVSAYSGGRADERPVVIFIDGRAVEVEVVEKWVSEDFNTRRRRRHFRLLDTSGFEYLVYQDEETSEWFLRV